MVLRKAEVQRGKGCSTCGKEVGLLSQTLSVCVDCLRSGKESLKPFIEKAHHRSREPFRLVNNPPRDRSGILCQVCINQCQISEGGWGYCGLRTQKEGALQGVSSEKGNVNWYYDGLLGMKGVGPKSLRSLSLISELIHGVQPSFKDPTRFIFAHGGKDGHPYPVDRKVYDQTIEVLKGAIDKARVGDREKMEAIRRLRHFTNIPHRASGIEHSVKTLCA